MLKMYDVEMEEVMGSVSETKREVSASRIMEMVSKKVYGLKVAGPITAATAREIEKGEKKYRAAINTANIKAMKKMARHIAALCMEKAVNNKFKAIVQAVDMRIAKNKNRGDAVVVDWSEGSVDECAALREGLITTQGKISILSGTHMNGVQRPGMEVSGYLEKKGKQLVSRDILSITFSFVKMAEQYLYAPIWYKPNGVNPIFLAQLIYPGNKTVFWDILRNEEYKGADLPRLNGQWYRYVFFGYTPAQARLNTCQLFNTVVKGSDGKYHIDTERARKLKSAVSLGATDLFAEAGLMTDKQIVQSEARPFQAMAGNKDFGSVTVWMLNGKFSISDGHDGTSFVTERHLLAALKAYYGIDMPKGSLLGLALQDRTGMDKAMTYVVSDWEMAALCKAYQRRGMDFTVYGKPDAAIPELLSDRNSWKAAISGLADVHMNIMAVVHEISQPTLNIQLIAKLAGSPHLDEIIRTCYRGLINQYFGFLRGDKEATLADVSAEMGSQTLLRCFPEFAKQYSGVLRGAVSTAAESAFKKLIRFNLPMPDSKWKTFFGDVAALFGLRVLGDHEVYCPWLKEGEKVVIIRFPSVHPNEFFTATAVGRETIMKRILGLDLPAIERTLLMSLVSHMSGSLIMTPNTDEFRTLTGGSDYDTDKGIVSKWDVLVKAFEGLKAHAIKGGAAKANTAAQRKYCLESSVFAFLTVIMSPKIGVVCNNLTAVIELMGMPVPEQIRVMSAVIGNENGTGAYSSHFTDVDGNNITNISVSDCKAAVYDMRKANLNDDTTRTAVLYDCLCIAKTEVDRTIDAPKTGDDVRPLLNWLKRDAVKVETDLFDAIVMELGKDGYSVGSKITRRGGRISSTRNALVDEFLADINDLMNTKVEMGQALSNLISSEAESKVTKSMVALKMMYGLITGLRRMDMASVATRNATVIQNKLKYSKAFFAAITNMGRMLAKEAGYDSVRLAKAALVASASRGHAYGKNIGNLFSTTLFSPELMRLAVENYGGENTEYFEEVHAINNAELVNGEMLTVAAGFCYRGKDKVAVMEKKIKAGSYEVAIKEDGAYLKKSILDVFAIPETNGTFMVNISSKTIDDNKGATNVVALLEQADNIVVSTPFVRGQHNDCIVLYKEGQEIARLGIAINGYALTKMLDCTSADIVSIKNGLIDNNGVARKAVVVLLNKNGVVDKGTIRKDEVHEEEDLSSLLNEYYVEEDCDLL